jgi:hypothetical protein
VPWACMGASPAAARCCRLPPATATRHRPQNYDSSLSLPCLKIDDDIQHTAKENTNRHAIVVGGICCGGGGGIDSMAAAPSSAK